MCIGDEFGVGAAMPERERQHAHQRTIAVLVDVIGMRRPLVDARTNLLERNAGLYADVEHDTVNGHVAIVVPAQQTPGEIAGVEASHVEQRCQQTQRLRTVVRPRAGRHATMGARESGWRRELDVVRRRDLGGGAELVRNAERIADEQADETAGDAGGAIGRR
jgi:hypothetical protein